MSESAEMRATLQKIWQAECKDMPAYLWDEIARHIGRASYQEMTTESFKAAMQSTRQFEDFFSKKTLS